MPLFNTRNLINAAIFIALTIILTHIFAIQTTFTRIDFGFLAIAVFSMRFGPLAGGLVAAIADIIGCIIFSPGMYFPGFTVSAFLTGTLYGIFYYNKPVTFLRALLANLAIILLVGLVLNTIWLSILYNKAATIIVYGRLIKCAIMLPLQTALVYLLQKRLSPFTLNPKSLHQ
ncbi:MAG: hypothetical protein H6Q75_352 [Firmicutes bacterium]|nr:hypothetical protein [Bacillota bacterium]